MKFTYHGQEHEVKLVDDGTLDTTIEVDGKTHTFVAEYAYVFRNEDGGINDEALRDLAIECLVEEEENYD